MWALLFFFLMPASAYIAIESAVSPRPGVVDVRTRSAAPHPSLACVRLFPLAEATGHRPQPAHAYDWRPALAAGSSWASATVSSCSTVGPDGSARVVFRGVPGAAYAVVGTVMDAATFAELHETQGVPPTVIVVPTDDWATQFHLPTIQLVGSSGVPHNVQLPFTPATDIMRVATELCEEQNLGNCPDLLNMLRQQAASVMSPSGVVWPLAVRATMEAVAAATGGQTVVFVQAGAMDGGGNGDPVFGAVRAYGWRGLVVEPLPRNFERLAQVYAPFPGVQPVHAAITNTTGTTVLVSAPASALASGSLGAALGMSAVQESGSFDSAKSAFATQFGAADTTEVPSITMKDLLARYTLPRMDVLQVDTEGCDWDIVRSVGGLPPHLHPRLIRMEYLLHSSPQQCVDVANFLLDLGYELHWVGVDLVATTAKLHTPDSNALPTCEDGTCGWWFGPPPHRR